MLQITENAKEELKRIRDNSAVSPDKFLRLAMAPVWEGEGDFGIVIGGEGYGDQVVVYQDSTILLVDPVLVDQLSKSILDFKDSKFSLDVY